MEQNFGDKLRYLRESRNMTLKELSSSLGIDTSMLGKIEKGTRIANPQIIKELSNLFGIEEEELNVSMISDQIVRQVVKRYDKQAHEILRVAERKVAYQKQNQNPKIRK